MDSRAYFINGYRMDIIMTLNRLGIVNVEVDHVVKLKCTLVFRIYIS